MTIDALKERLPDYARDLKLNLSTLASEPGLTEQQRWGAMLASAIAARNPTVIAAIAAETATRLSPEAITAAKTAAAIMAMNNIYYRFTHLVSQADYRTMPARLRMNALANPGVDKGDFELWSLAVSSINGCGMCLEAHEQGVRKAGLSTQAIQNVVRIAAVIHAVSVTLAGEAALTS
ncbi:MAG: carboxymuconolactone decarboxylase family protein [Rhodospirillaceae bacterium]